MNDRYQSPLSERYASKEMQYIFSPDKKFKTWRKLWIALAETEKELGLDITQEQIDELKAHAEDINYDVAKEREKLNQMSSSRIALGKPLTDGELLKQNEMCGGIGIDIMKLQELLNEDEGEQFEE